MPKSFRSFRDQQAVKCSLKTNDGLLYPLEKSFIFINKPTELIRFEDIEMCEFQRYVPAANSGRVLHCYCTAAAVIILVLELIEFVREATRNFDLVITIRPNTSLDAREFVFMGIERTEFSSLHLFLTSKKIPIKAIEVISFLCNSFAAFVLIIVEMSFTI